jgi:hypothetical protein
MAPYQALTTLRAGYFSAEIFCSPKAESAVSDLAPSRPEGTLSQVRHRALGASAIEAKSASIKNVYYAPPRR